jgi:hypothetical protein
MNWDGELTCVSVGGIPVEKLFFGQDVDTCMYICLADSRVVEISGSALN